MNRVTTIIVCVLLVLLFTIHLSFADTRISYSGMPAPAAISPSISGFNNKMCRTGISAAYSGGIFSASGGTTIVDETCEKVVLADALERLGLKVAAVGVLCQDPRVFKSMLQAGSPCSINGAIGDAALHAWYELKPEVFEELYGKDWRPPTITAPME